MLYLKKGLLVTLSLVLGLVSGSVAWANGPTADIGPLIDPNGFSLVSSAMPGDSDIGPLIDPNGRG